MVRSDPREETVPLSLLIVGTLTLFFISLVRVGMGALIPIVIALVIYLVVTGLLMLAAAYIADRWVGVEMGDLQVAVMKLLGASAASAALAALINVTGLSWLFSTLMFLGLVMYLFGLMLRDTYILAGVLIVVRLAAAFVIFYVTAAAGDHM